MSSKVDMNRSGNFYVTTTAEDRHASQVANLREAVADLLRQVLAVSQHTPVTTQHALNTTVGPISDSDFTPLVSTQVTLTQEGYIWAYATVCIINHDDACGAANLKIVINDAMSHPIQDKLCPRQTVLLSVHERSGILQPGTYTVTAYASRKDVAADVEHCSMYAQGVPNLLYYA